MSHIELLFLLLKKENLLIPQAIATWSRPELMSPLTIVWWLLWAYRFRGWEAESWSRFSLMEWWGVKWAEWIEWFADSWGLVRWHWGDLLRRRRHHTKRVHWADHSDAHLTLDVPQRLVLVPLLQAQVRLMLISLLSLNENLGTHDVFLFGDLDELLLHQFDQVSCLRDLSPFNL